MQETRSQSLVLSVFGVLFSVIAVVALVALIDLKTRADTAIESVSVSNAGPSIESVVASESANGPAVSLSSGFTPNEGNTKALYVYGVASDANGCTDIERVDIVVYRSGQGANCVADNNDCYRTSIPAVSLTNCLPGATTTVDFSTMFNVENYVDATDAGPYQVTDQDWIVAATAVDGSRAAASLESHFQVNSVAALDVSPAAIVYGSLGLGADSSEQQVLFTTTGNRAVNSFVQANQDMVSNLVGFAHIAATQVHFSLTSGFDWGVGDAAITSSTATIIPLNLEAQADDAGPAPALETYFKLRVPTTGLNGTYSNTLVFTATTL